MQRPTDMRIQGLGSGSAGEIGRALIELDERTLNFLVVHLLLREAGKRAQQERGSYEPHRIDSNRPGGS